jgi:outer membrane protein, adhesin transport system
MIMRGFMCIPLLALAACSSPKARLLEPSAPSSAVVETELATASTSVPSQSAVLELPQAVRLALQRHPDILRAKSYVSKSQTGIALAQSVWYPELTYGVSPTYSSTSYGSATAGVSQLVYDFGKSKAELNSATALHAKSEHEVDQAKESVAAQIAQDYATLAASLDQIEKAKSFLSDLQKLEAKVQSRVSAGASDGGDISTASIAVDRAKGEILRAQSSFAIAQSNIAQVLGEAPQRVSAISEIAVLLEKIKEQHAIKNSPSLLALQSAVEAARSNVDRAHADVLPPVKIAGQYTEQAGNTGLSGSGWVGLQVTGAFSTSGAAGQRIAAAESDFEVAQQLLESEKLRLRTASGAIDIELNAAKQRAQNYKRIYQMAARSSLLSWQEYQLDKKPLNEVISAEREKYLAMSDLNTAGADFIKASIRGLANKGEFADGVLSADRQ